MKQNYVRKLLIVGTVSGSLLLSMGSMALANTATPKTTPRIQASKQMKDFSGKFFQKTSFRMHENRSGGYLTDVLDAVLKDGTITPSQKDAILNKAKQLRKEKMTERFNEQLKPLLDAKVITPDQAAKFIEYAEKQKEEHQKLFESTKDMSKEQKQEFFKKMHTERKDILTQMIEDGVLTEAQAAEIRKTMPKQRSSRMPTQ